MAWIESHQTLGQHPKTIVFAEHLHCSLPTAVGHLHYLWWWALDFAPHGQIRTTPAVVAHACYWRGNAQQFWQALILAGFMDVDEDLVTIHDWMEYGGKLAEQRELRRESNRQAQSARRQRLRQQVSTAESARSQQSTGHNSTQHYRTQPDTPPGPPPDVSADALLTPPTNGQLTTSCCTKFAQTGREHLGSCPTRVAA